MRKGKKKPKIRMKKKREKNNLKRIQMQLPMVN